MTDAETQRAYVHGMQQRGAAGTACLTADALQQLATRRQHDDASLTRIDHIMSCAACNEAYELLRSVHVVAESSAPRARSRPRNLRPALVLLAASVLVFVVVDQTGRVGDGALAVGTETVVMRSGSSDVARVAFLPGTTELQRGDSLLMAWRPVAQASTYGIELLADDGRVLASRTTSDTMVVFAADVVPPELRAVQWLVVARRGDGNSVRSALLRMPIR